ncbi:hypothetical protein V1478_015786 [Vespula squamosa]|uniref:Uncharacterized protein n=1 Tax=Vespula squamosa TaxID=30214 RepID=A0ABD2A1T6_VESSQ
MHLNTFGHVRLISGWRETHEVAHNTIERVRRMIRRKKSVHYQLKNVKFEEDISEIKVNNCDYEIG